MPPIRSRKNRYTVSTRRTQREPDSIYNALSVNRQEIRLLHILPALRQPDPIHCYLSTARLKNKTPDQDPHYEALSYAWGTEVHDSPIYVEEQPRKVSVNLYQALQHLRHPSQERIMWIDALCIDQSNPSERACQVALMRTIYGKAISTTIWLGASSGKECEIAMQFLELLGNNDTLHPFSEDPHLKIDGKSLKSEETITGLELFSSSSWWSRVWTVQEWVLSRHPIFQHGTQTLDGKVAQKAIRNMRLHTFEEGCCGLESSSYDYMRPLDSMNAVRRQYAGFSLPYIISEFGLTRRATDPRDRIYGLLGLAQSPYKDAIVADYTSSVESVFRTAALQMIKTGSLEVFSHIPIHGERNLSIPSYVPDWTASHTLQCFPDWLSRVAHVSLFRACKDEPADLIIIDSETVCLKGITVDKVLLKVSIFNESEPTDPAAMIRYLSSIVGLRDQSARLVNHKIDESNFWSTVCGSLEVFTDPDGDLSIRRLSTDSSRQSARFKRWMTWCLTIGAVHEDKSVSDEGIRSLIETFGIVSEGRSFVVTKSGRLAWCPQTCQEGDIISVLAGGRVPFVLRKVEGQENYQLVGDAYVHGIMDGEAVDEMYNDGNDWEYFDLI